MPFVFSLLSMCDQVIVHAFYSFICMLFIIVMKSESGVSSDQLIIN